MGMPTGRIRVVPLWVKAQPLSSKLRGRRNHNPVPSGQDQSAVTTQRRGISGTSEWRVARGGLLEEVS